MKAFYDNNDILSIIAYQSDNALKIEGLANKEIDHAIFYNPTLEGQTIVEYCGVVTGEAILGANIFRDFFAGIRDIVGGRSGAYEKELRKAREIAFEELGDQARALGADAVVGIDIDYETVGQNGSMLMVSVSGTAVKTRR